MDPNYDPLESAMRLGPEVANQTAPPPDYDPLEAARKLNDKPILSTSHTTLPRDANGGVGIPWTEEAFQEDYAQHPIGVPEPIGRTGQAVVDAYKNTPPLLTPRARAAVDNSGFLGQQIYNPILDAAGGALGVGAGIGAGIGQGAYELGNAVSPRLGRDAYMLQQAIQTLLPQAAGPRAGLKPPGTPEVTQGAPRSVMERMAPPPIEGQTTLGRAIDLLRHDEQWNNPNAPGYHPPGFDPNQPTLIPPGAAPPPAGPPMSGVPDTLLTRALGPDPATIIRPAPELPAISSPPGAVENAKNIAAAYFDIAHKNNAEISSGSMNRFFDNATSGLDRQTPQGISTAGPDPVTQLMTRWDRDLRNQPSTLQGVTEMDRHLGSLITQEYGPTGISDIGRQLQQIQRNLRDHVENVGPDDVTGGTAGIDALQPGRKAWSQALKMDDIIRMQERADRTQNPTQSIKTQANTLLSSRTKSRGWSDEEKAALEQASERGVIGNVFYGLGSRLMSKAGAAAGASVGGLPGMAIGYGIGEGGSAIARSIANRISASRIQQALDVLNKSVPPPP